MPDVSQLSPDDLRRAIESSDHLAHVIPASSIDVELGIKLDTYHADLLSEAEQRVEREQRRRTDRAMRQIQDQES